MVTKYHAFLLLLPSVVEGQHPRAMSMSPFDNALINSHGL